ncbi:MAG TPA: CRISPR-associated endonuclease Cas1 [Candidatus Cloacimonetes bacterium]|nr:CRISPR-associated endonuclease Cas1 [Candidatus Cloacimonadota bacterium]
MQLFLKSYGTYLHKVGELFEMRIDEKKQRISPKRISSIIVANAAQITTDAIQLAMEYNIDIVFIDQYGDPYGRIWYPKLGSTTYIRRKLLEIYDKDEGLEAVKIWIGRKIQNQISFLRQLVKKRNQPLVGIHQKIEEMVNQKKKLTGISGVIEERRFNVLGTEGNVSRLYFDAISLLLPRKYKFHGRSFRPAKDQFNAVLNYGYGMLYSKVEKALIIAGLDPYIGILHTDNYNKKSLVFDMIEPYRILVERPIFYQFSRRKINDCYFTVEKQGFQLNDEGKQYIVPIILEEFDQIIRYKNRNLKQIDMIQADAHAFANYLIGKRKDF